MACIISYLIAPPVETEERALGGLDTYCLSYVISLVAAAVIFYVPLLSEYERTGELLPDIAARYTQYFDDMVSVIKYSKWSEDIKMAILNEIRTTLLIVQEYDQRSFSGKKWRAWQVR